MLQLTLTVEANEENQPKLFTTAGLQIAAAKRYGILPSVTMGAANRLYEAALITSPLNNDPVQGIEPVGRTPDALRKNDARVYDLIAENAWNTITSTAVKTGTLSVEIDGMTFSRTLSSERVTNLDEGQTYTAAPFLTAKVATRTKQSTLTYELHSTLAYLYHQTSGVTPYFTSSTDDLGMALTRLVHKGLAKFTDGMVFLSDKGEDIMDQIARLYPAACIIGYQQEANRLTDGISTGKKCIADFSEWLGGFVLEIVGKAQCNGLEDVVCPKCGLHSLTRNATHYRCVECGYAMPVNYMGRSISAPHFRNLMKYFYTSEMHGFKADDTNRFSSMLVLDSDFQPRHVESLTYPELLPEAV